MRCIHFQWQDFEEEIRNMYDLTFPESSFSEELYSLEQAMGHKAISIFTDCIVADYDLHKLKESGVEIVALRHAGYDNINVSLAKELGLKVYRVAEYSPESIAEHAFALLLGVIRKFPYEMSKHRFNAHIRNKRSLGMTLHNRAIGLYGLGKIGKALAQIAKGFGMYVMYYDPYVKSFHGAEKVDSLPELFKRSQIVSINVPLNEHTQYSVNYDLFKEISFHPFYLVNTARGDIVKSEDVLKALEEGLLSGAGIDTWDSGHTDDKFDQRLLAHNVIQTKHTAFLTQDAVKTILEDTIENVNDEPKERNIL